MSLKLFICQNLIEGFVCILLIKKYYLQSQKLIIKENNSSKLIASKVNYKVENLMWNPYVYDIPVDNDYSEIVQNQLNTIQKSNYKQVSSNYRRMFEVTYKLNGHIKKIRKKEMLDIGDEILGQIQQYISQFDKNHKVQRHLGQIQKVVNYLHRSHHNDVLNINVKPISIGPQESQTRNNIYNRLNEDNHIKSTQTQQANQQTLSLLKQQIKLFQSQGDIHTFIETQLNTAQNVEQQLSSLLFNALKISFQLLATQYSSQISSIDQLFNNKEFKNWHQKEQIVMIKENLQKIEDKCLDTLHRIKEQRRKLEICAICLEKKSNTILMPCMHLGVCQNCSKMLQKCPFCKTGISSRKQVYK